MDKIPQGYNEHCFWSFSTPGIPSEQYGFSFQHPEVAEDCQLGVKQDKQ
jgi:hypothetical protein